MGKLSYVFIIFSLIRLLIGVARLLSLPRYNVHLESSHVERSLLPDAIRLD